MSDDLATLVKRLVWHQSGGTHTMDGESHTVPTGYSVRYADENGWKWSTPLGAYGWERSPSLAKAAAQADHISKTIAALNPEALARWREEAVQAEREAIADLLEIIFAASDGIELRLGGTSETITLIEIVATIRAQRFTDEDLLRELIRRNGIVEAPTSRTMHEYEVLLGIGKDHHCYITFDKEDVEALT